MPNEKENIKDQLQSIKQNLEKKLSEENNIVPKETESKQKKKQVKQNKNISIETKFEIVEEIPKKEEVKPSVNKTTKKPIKPEIKNEKISKPKPSKPENSKKKKKGILIPVFIISSLLAVLGYVFSLKGDLENTKKDFEQAKKEDIDYRKDVYFKEVPDEVEDEEMQDFAVYKDVPEVVAEKNTETQILSANDSKSINKQIKESEKNRKISKPTPTKSISAPNDPNTNSTVIDQVDNTASDKKTEVSTTNKEGNDAIDSNVVFSDYIKVVGLEYKNGKPTIPKKAKKTNAFKIRVRLKKNQISTTEKDVEVMLVVKDATGKTLKIDSKKINFGSQRSKVLYLEFYEVFSDRLQTGLEYTFSVFANKKLLKTGRKTL